MKRQFPALLLTLALLLSLSACGGTKQVAKQSPNAEAAEPSPDTEADTGQRIKVGLVCGGGEDDQGDTYNFILGRNDAAVMLAAEGIGVEWRVMWDVPQDGACEDANRALADEGCQLIFNDSPGFEAFMRNVAPEYPDVQFVSCGGQASRADELPNTHNAFANIHEGRYLAGVVAGLKLQERMDSAAVIGYVCADTRPEAVSGYTAYFLGVRSVCPGVTMKVSADASALADMGCALISQHSGDIEPALVAQSAGILHTGYIHDMTAAAPDASLVSTRIDWYVYLDHAIRAVLDGRELEQDWCHGLDMYAVELTPLNRDLIADGTDEALDELKAALADGSLQVFDTSTFTVNGATLDTGDAVFDGAFHESYLQSAPYFALAVDGIEILD